MNFNGKLTTKVVIKDDYVRSNGTCALYIQVFLNRERKRFPCDISVKPADFDKQKQRVKTSLKDYKDLNLMIEKMLGDINKIEVTYRLSSMNLTIEKLENEYKNPSSRLDFLSFWETQMIRQKEILKIGSYNQQMASLRKVKAYRKVLFFYDINADFLEDMKAHFKKKLKNSEITIQTTIRHFKKYLHIANKKGIITPIDYTEIKTKEVKGKRTFLMPDEVFNLYQYWQDEYVSPTLKPILTKFLFACFTGLRFTDVEQLEEDNFTDNILFFVAEKTQKIQRIALNKPAQKFAKDPDLINKNYTNQHTNRELKEICKFRGIKKNVTFHVARHTFATNFLLSGGRVEVLQKLLNHTNIQETMIYVHIVDSITDQQIHNMDEILKL